MIPKILHQLWIGPKPAPTKFMDTWKDKNPDFEYIRWNEEEIQKRGLQLECTQRINEMEEINGKADIIRWEILYKYGGVFVDADSICIEAIDDTLMKTKCFAGWEQEELRKNLIATGTMGFPPKHPLVRHAIDHIKANEVSNKATQQRAWKTVGPLLLTKLYFTGKYNDLTIFPSYYFLPIHCTGKEYKGHGKIYAYQEWGSTKRNYEIMNSKSLPSQFLKPEDSVSILVSSLNTKSIYIKECLDSIKEQTAFCNIELIWINDGSDTLNTQLLKRHLSNFEKTTRFTKVIYYDNETNKGIGYTLNMGVNMCNNEIIIKMDSDDIMVPERIEKQLAFMKDNPNIKICGGQIRMFSDDNKDNTKNISNHPTITWEQYKNKPSHWFINHPTVCYRKSAILEAGNYDKDLKQMCEDFELELRMLKTHGVIHNFPDILLHYRLHSNQVTYNGGIGGKNYWTNIRNNIISNLLK